MQDKLADWAVQAVINQISQILGHTNYTSALKNAFLSNKDAMINSNYVQEGSADR